MKSLVRAAVVAALAGGTTFVASVTAHAQEPPPATIEFEVSFSGIGSTEALDATALELFEGEAGGDVLPGADCGDAEVFTEAGFASRRQTCDIPSGTYTVGLNPLPAGYDMYVYCSIGGPNDAAVGAPDRERLTVSGSQFSVNPDDTAYCTIQLWKYETFEVFLGTNSYDIDALNSITPELFDTGTDVLPGATCIEESAVGSDGSYRIVGCDVAPSTYQLGLANVPHNWLIDEVYCESDSGNPEEALPPGEYDSEFTIGEDGDGYCYVYLLAPPTVLIDTQVIGGDATVADFEIELYAEGELVGAGHDTDPANCVIPSQPSDQIQAELDIDEGDLSHCLPLDLVPGTYALGATMPEYGYVFDGFACENFEAFGRRAFEMFEGGEATFEHGIDGSFSDDPQHTLCTVTFRHVTQTVKADLIVINDSGRSNDGSAVEIEVFNSSGTKVDDKVDPAPNDPATSAEFDLPIGPYTFGISGADGYVTSVVVAEVDTSADTEAIDDPTADFTTDEDTTVNGVLTIDDEALPTTTTSPPSTTVSPTTVSPTTSIVGAGAGVSTTLAPVLPNTGSDQSNTMMALLALVLLMLGSGTLAFARRR